MMGDSARRKVLLTGAAGNIGRGFRDEYVARYREYYDLRVGVRRAEQFDDRFDDNVVIDIEDNASLSEACRGVETVIHLAANPDWQAPWDELLGPNITGTYNMFEAAREAGCRRMIY